MDIDSSSEIVVELRNHVSIVTLNRPKALNALSWGMIKSLTDHFRRFAIDDRVKAVVMKGSGEKAFCAGGDIRFLHASASAGKSDHMGFFTDEYRLNHLLHRFVKPVVCVLDGIVMGGGMGISQGSGFRIVGPKTKMAMPETAIGLIPDVGGSYFLSRSPVGLYLGITGLTIGAADALYANLADRYMTTEAVSDLQEALTTLAWSNSPATQVAALIDAHASNAGPAPLATLRPAIDEHFAPQKSVREIIASLDRESRPAYQEWAAHTAALLRKRSPTFMEVTRRQLNRGAKMPLEDCFRMELGIMQRAFESGEPLEGIRALIIDKDQSPRWQPDSVDTLTDAHVARLFEPPWSVEAHPLAELR